MYVLILSVISYDMVHTKDGTLKTTLQNFYIIALNSDISVNICSVFSQSLENVVYCLPKESYLKMLIKVQVIFLCYVKFLKKYFFTTINDLYHKNVTRTYMTVLRHFSLG